MLETFLPFQLEYVFSAGMLLIILGAILPSYVPDSNWSRAVHLVLDEMIRKKNAVAHLRKSELDQLVTLLNQLRGYGPPNLRDTSSNNDTGGGIATNFPDDTATASMPDNNESDGFGLPWDASYGMGNPFFTNSDQILELAEQLETGDLPSSLLAGSVP